MLTVVANGDPPAPRLLKRLFQQSEGLVAVDGGLAACDQAGLAPDIILGDLDSAPPSLLEKYRHIPLIETPNQNKTDLEKALEYLFNFGFEDLAICGALGKRIDHTLANLALLARFPNKIRFESNDEQCFALPKFCEVKARIGQTLSLIPLSTVVTGVQTEGLKWELNGEILSKEFASISNICVQETIQISFKEGDLLIALNR